MSIKPTFDNLNEVFFDQARNYYLDNEYFEGEAIQIIEDNPLTPAVIAILVGLTFLFVEGAIGGAGLLNHFHVITLPQSLQMSVLVSSLHVGTGVVCGGISVCLGLNDYFQTKKLRDPQLEENSQAKQSFLDNVKLIEDSFDWDSQKILGIPRDQITLVPKTENTFLKNNGKNYIVWLDSSMLRFSRILTDGEVEKISNYFKAIKVKEYAPLQYESFEPIDTESSEPIDTESSDSD